MPSNRHHMFVIPAMLLALGGCGQLGLPGNSVAGAVGAVTGDAAGAKLDTYTEGYNKLVGTFGLPETAQKYEEERIASKSASDNITISDGWIEQSLAKLKEARAMSGGPADLDKAADALIASLDAVQKRLVPLETYYTSKAYKEDNLARGKSEDPQMNAEFKAALGAADAFNAVLKRERDARGAVELQKLKAEGNTLAYATKAALQKGEQLVGLFNTAEDVKNPAVFAKGDAIVADLDKLLAEQRGALAAAKASGKGQPDVNYGLVEGDLTRLIGTYRELKQSHDPDDANQMVKAYNRAVDNANDIRS